MRSLCNVAQQASSCNLDQGAGTPDLSTQIALLLFSTVLDDLSDTGYITEKDVMVAAVQVRNPVVRSSAACFAALRI